MTDYSNFRNICFFYVALGFAVIQFRMVTFIATFIILKEPFLALYALLIYIIFMIMRLRTDQPIYSESRIIFSCPQIRPLAQSAVQKIRESDVSKATLIYFLTSLLLKMLLL